jgi:hypothetical protein
MYFISIVTGSTFYLFAYLWQIVVVTLGLLALYAIIRKNWSLLKKTIIASFFGGLI